jgi:DHA1 family bicyclomycin/chloramphenicol resistance-like MFS transporter
MATNMINARLVHRVGGARLIRFGTGTAAVAGIILAIAARWDIGGLAGLVIPLFVYVSVTGFVVANTIAGALRDFPQRAGSVSALVGSIQYGSGIFGSALVGAFANGTPWPFALVIAVSCIGSFLCALLLSVSPLEIDA